MAGRYYALVKHKKEVQTTNTEDMEVRLLSHEPLPSSQPPYPVGEPSGFPRDQHHNYGINDAPPSSNKIPLYDKPPRNMSENPVSRPPPVGFEKLSQRDGSGTTSPISEDKPSPTAADGITLTGSARRRKRKKVEDEKDYREVEHNQGDTIYFRDGIRKIDYVLAYEIQAEDEEKRDRKKLKRAAFQANLERNGLELEIEDVEFSSDGKTYFVKIHAPWDSLCKGAENMLMKMPIKENDLYCETFTQRVYERCCCANPFQLAERDIPEESNYFTAAFKRDKLHKFIIGENKDDFFTNGQRSRIVCRYLMKMKYGDNQKHQIGIQRLLANGTYLAAYPLHEGQPKMEHSMLTHKPSNDRQLLFHHWARPGRWWKEQPLDLIRKYFGEKIGLYFSWLGFYTGMLFPAAFLGLFTLIYGIATINDNQQIKDICESAKGAYPMCPRCDERCPFWSLNDSCLYAKLSYLLDNNCTVAFAVFMSIWATVFLELWKRKQAEIRYDWDLMTFEDEEELPRAEFEALVTSTRKNPITQLEEPHVRLRTRIPKYILAFNVVLMMTSLVIIAVIGVIIYRVALNATLASNKDLKMSYIGIIASVTAALINLICIMILNKLYERLAWYLTTWEMPKTQTNFDDSYTFKMYMFQFVNFYASLFYIAFFKLNPGAPGKYNRLFGFRREECHPGGCLFELGVQLMVIMVGKQIFNNFIEIIVPKVMNWIRRRDNLPSQKDERLARWEKDYDLTPIPPQGMFYEYLEMVIQFGFVTLFVAAFPLGPLFALLNNLIEIRVDAYKLVCVFRRPLAERAPSLGMWNSILVGIVRLSVVVNALVIGFVSEFVPRLYYQIAISKDGSLHGFLNDSLSCYDVRQFTLKDAPVDTFFQKFNNNSCGYGLPMCRYRGYYNRPYIYINNQTVANPEADSYRTAHWHIIASKLFFVVIFEHAVFLLTGLIEWAIPDIPEFLYNEMKRENYLARQALESEENTGEQVDNVDYHDQL